MHSVRYLKLNTGHCMPIVGLGTFHLKGESLKSSLHAAIGAGYKLIDTASVYKNEEDIGNILECMIASDVVKREEIFVTSKLGPKDHGTVAARNACLKSIQHLKCKFIDLYLIHWPGTQGIKHDDPQNKVLRKQSWLAMEQLYKEGHVKAIGVSNYLQHHLDELLQYCSVKPAVIQNEHHPHLNQMNLVKYCQDQNIVYQAYSSLGTDKTTELIRNPLISEIAKEHGKSSSQILLRWATQQSIAVIPKSSNPNHIKENLDLFTFELSPESMHILNNMDQQKHYTWDPSTVT